jgi:Holliday junction resolvase RusA-like endonuclease
MLRAVRQADAEVPFIPEGPVHLTVVCFFPLPKAERRKRGKVGARYHYKHGADLSNIAKGVEDAGNGILYSDDSQIASSVCTKWVCAQGQDPHTHISVRSMSASFSFKGE